MELESEEIRELYAELERHHENNLKEKGVKLPTLRYGGNYSKGALVLVYLYEKMGKPVSKEELTEFVRKYHPTTNDVQQARHLGQQKGWYIVSRTRKDTEALERNFESGEYSLISVKEHYPRFTEEKRVQSEDSFWEDLKEEYDRRCATCGSKEGEPNVHYPNTETTLQKGHMDPRKSLSKSNTIPQCEKCNRADRNYFVYNNKGRVVEIADPKFVLKSNEKTQKEMLKVLIKKHEGLSRKLLSKNLKDYE